MAIGNVLLTSGFIIPENKWFTTISDDATYRERLLGDGNGLDLVPKLHALITKGDISSSVTANEAYLNYTNDPSFENYMAMVDIFTDVFKDYNFVKFCKDQVVNSYLSPMGFSLILDILTGWKSINYSLYEAVPGFFTMAMNSDPKELTTRETRLNKVLDSSTLLSTSGYLTNLIQDKKVFASVFKFILVDFNRGGNYA